MKRPVIIPEDRHAIVFPKQAVDPARRHIGEIVLVASRTVTYERPRPGVFHIMSPPPDITYHPLQAGILRTGEVDLVNLVDIPVEYAVIQPRHTDTWRPRTAHDFPYHLHGTGEEPTRRIGTYIRDHDKALVIFGDRSVESFLSLYPSLPFDHPDSISEKPWQNTFTGGVYSYVALCRALDLKPSRAGWETYVAGRRGQANHTVNRTTALGQEAQLRSLDELIPFVEEFPDMELDNGMKLSEYVARVETARKALEALPTPPKKG